MSPIDGRDSRWPLTELETPLLSTVLRVIPYCIDLVLYASENHVYVPELSGAD